jgi:hypothetical protein
MEKCKFILGDFVIVIKEGFYHKCEGRCTQMRKLEGLPISYVVKFDFEGTFDVFNEQDLILKDRTHGY